MNVWQDAPDGVDPASERPGVAGQPLETGSAGSGTRPEAAGPDVSGSEAAGAESPSALAEGRQALAADEAAQSRVAGIVDRARERNLGRASELASWIAVAERGSLTDQDRVVAAEVAHQLAGSAGTFGYLAATDIAREVEQSFTEGDGAEHWRRTAERIDDLTARLHEEPELESPPQADGS